MGEAKERQIRFLSDFHYPQNTKLNAFDLSVIMNNALNNCMENVSGDDPYISISSYNDSVYLFHRRCGPRRCSRSVFSVLL